MNNLKCRAWDGSKMVKVRSIELSDSGEITVLYEDDGQIVRRDLSILRYCGIKDKNGREYCVGDLFKVVRTGRQDMLGEVYERDNEIRHRIKYFPPMKGQRKDFFLSGAVGTELEDYEIIGSIYENPDLIA